MTAGPGGPAYRALELYAIAPTLYGAGGRTVDVGAMAACAERMVGHGIRDFLLTGSYGEFQSLTDDERVHVLRAVRAVNGVRAVMACAAQPATAATAELAARLLGEGADEVMVAAPFAAEVRRDEILRHFRQLSRQLPGGIVVYNNPAFGMDLPPADLAEITSLPGIAAVKQGTASLPGLAESISAVHARSGDEVRMLAASDLTGVLGLLAGADGLTSTNCWAFPGAFRSLVGSAAAGDWESARQVAAALDPYFAVVRRLGQPRTVKAAMQARGLPGTRNVRLPYRPLKAPECALLRIALEECDKALAQVGEIQQPEAKGG
ncbi:MAG: dihydrodipicolinate synthase family protein [Streptosporangiaceae bacterium]